MTSDVGDNARVGSNGRLRRGETRGRIFVRDGNRVGLFSERRMFRRLKERVTLPGGGEIQNWAVAEDMREYEAEQDMTWPPAPRWRAGVDGRTETSMFVRGVGFLVGEAADRERDRDVDNFLSGKGLGFPLTYEVIEKLRGGGKKNRMEGDLTDEEEGSDGVAEEQDGASDQCAYEAPWLEAA